MDSATFKKRCDNMKNEHFSGDEALLGSARNGLFETKLLLEALWECCARLETDNAMLRTNISTLKAANRALDDQNRRLKDRMHELKETARSVIMALTATEDFYPEGRGWLGDLDTIIKSLNELEADFEKKEFFQGACWVHVIAEQLKKAPTIIESEGGTDK